MEEKRAAAGGTTDPRTPARLPSEGPGALLRIGSPLLHPGALVLWRGGGCGAETTGRPCGGIRPLQPRPPRLAGKERGGRQQETLLRFSRRGGGFGGLCYSWGQAAWENSSPGQSFSSERMGSAAPANSRCLRSPLPLRS